MPTLTHPQFDTIIDGMAAANSPVFVVPVMTMRIRLRLAL